jgi:hypothetical protein
MVGPPLATNDTTELGQSMETESALSTDDDEQTSSLDRTFAGMLAELEDEATRLTQRHDALLRQADEVAAELERVEAVRAAMVGKPKPARRGRPKAAPAAAPTTKGIQGQERVRRITAYARDHGGTFTGRDAAEAIGVPYQGIGPVLAGMVRRGEVTVAEPEGDGPRVYTLAA